MPLYLPLCPLVKGDDRVKRVKSLDIMIKIYMYTDKHKFRQKKKHRITGEYLACTAGKQIAACISSYRQQAYMHARGFKRTCCCK